MCYANRKQFLKLYCQHLLNIYDNFTGSLDSLSVMSTPVLDLMIKE